MSEDEKQQVLGSVLADQLSAIQEAVKDVPEIKIKLDKMERILSDVGSDVRVSKAAITDLSHQVNEHERQIARLQSI